MNIRETPFYYIVTVKTYLYDKKSDWGRYIDIIKSLGGRFDWNAKVWYVSKEHKLELFSGLRVTFTENEIREADIWFQDWWSSLSADEESLFSPSAI